MSSFHQEEITFIFHGIIVVKQRLMNRLVVLLFFISSLAFGQNSLLWQITKDGVKDTSYLYGTIHLPNKKYFYVNPKIHELKRKVDAGVFEVELTQDSLVFISMAMMGKSGERVADLYTPKEQGIIFDYFKSKIGMEKLMVNNFSPIALTAAMLQSLITSDTTSAIDQMMQTDFKRMGKKVIPLESIKMQLDLLTGMPIDIQKKELWEAVNNHDSLVNSIHDLDSVYMNQDLKGISALLDDLKAEEYLSKALLNDNRNLKMVKKLTELLPKQSNLICVGAAHLGGEKGLIKLLSDKGYVVTALN